MKMSQSGIVIAHCFLTKSILIACEFNCLVIEMIAPYIAFRWCTLLYITSFRSYFIQETTLLNKELITFFGQSY